MLSTPYPLDEATVAGFRQNGHCLLRGLASPEEIARYHPLIRRAAERYNTEQRALEERDTYGKAFLQVMNLWTRDEGVREFVLAQRFAATAARLLGVERVRVYHDQALYKEPGGGPTPWHQDQYYWPLDTDATVTMWMPLVDITAEMGMLNFASGSHEGGAVGTVAISDDSDALFQRHVEERAFPVTEQAEMRAGDATFHTGWVIHNAGPNRSPDVTREVMTVIYFADGAHVSEPANADQENDRQRWLDGLEPGRRAASRLNPVP